jgi:hypothetical protein
VTLLRGLEWGEDICKCLPDSRIAPEEFFTATVEVLLRHDRLRDPELVEAIARARPRRRREALELSGETTVEDERTLASVSVSAQISQSASASATVQDTVTLRPTLGTWCSRHGRALAVLCGLPLIVAAAILVVPGIEFYTEDGQPATSNFRYAMFAGQTIFAALAFACMAPWSEPGASWIFGPSREYERLQARLTQLEHPEQMPVDERAELLTAVGADPRGNEDLVPWFDAASHAQQQLHMVWSVLWAVWFVFHAFQFVIALLPIHGTPVRSCLHAAMTTFLNNGTAMLLFVGFWILTFVTVPIAGRRRRGNAPPGALRFIALAALVVVMLLAVHVTCIFALAGQERIDDVNTGFLFVSGILVGGCMAMFVGRLDSKFLNAGWPMIGALFLYAAIQPGWAVLKLIRAAATESAAQPSPWLELLFAYAWIGKLIFFVVFAWIYHTGRLEFYFLRMRRLQARMAADWYRLCG